MEAIVAFLQLSLTSHAKVKVTLNLHVAETLFRGLDDIDIPQSSPAPPQPIYSGDQPGRRQHMVLILQQKKWKEIKKKANGRFLTPQLLLSGSI